MIEAQHASESLAPSDGSRASADPRGTLQQPVADSLMIALVMVVRDVFGECALQGGPAEENHAIQAFALHRAHESLGEGIQIR